VLVIDTLFPSTTAAMSSFASVVTPFQTQDVDMNDEDEQIVLLGSLQVAVGEFKTTKSVSCSRCVSFAYSLILDLHLS
jgi:hypothetical protein